MDSRSCIVYDFDCLNQMKIVMIDKVPFVRMCKMFFKLEYGPIDLDEVLNLLCEGIRGDASDREHIREMAFGDLLFQGHQEEPMPDYKKAELRALLTDIRGRIIREIFDSSGYAKHAHVHFLRTSSALSLSFEVF